MCYPERSLAGASGPGVPGEGAEPPAAGPPPSVRARRLSAFGWLPGALGLGLSVGSGGWERAGGGAEAALLELQVSVELASRVDDTWQDPWLE